MEYFEIGSSHFLPKMNSVVTFVPSTDYLSSDDIVAKKVTIQKKEYEMVPWGESDDLPLRIIEKVYKSPVLTSGHLFNISLGYGEGIMPCYKEYGDDGKLKIIPVTDNEEINLFFEENDISLYLLEQLSDLNFFYNVYPEIILSLERKVVSLKSKEAAFSRVTTMDLKTGKIPFHLYSAQWGVKTPDDTEVTVTPMLDYHNPTRDLRIRMGLEPDEKGRTQAPKDYRFIVPVSFPTPGKFYYQKPYWYSIIESGWYDYAARIPAFKNALLDNQMFIKYQIELADTYFLDIFNAEGITDDEKKKARIRKEYDNINAFLSGAENSGKSVISFTKYTVDGKEQRKMKVIPIEQKTVGGEYLDDSEEASNIGSYALGVHPSLIGSSPGKAKTINGTEARELFIIKQALMKPIRDRILKPLYLIKNINGWDPNIQFVIPHMELTTLDSGSGSKEVIS